FRPQVLALCALCLAAAVVRGQPIPDRPEKLEFPPLTFEPPDPSEYRVELKSGPVAYVIEDRELPLVNVLVLVRTGTYLEPPAKAGLAALTGQLLVRGGAGDMTAEELDERLDFLAAQMSSSIGPTEGSVRLNLLSKDIDEGLSILRDVLTAPRFQEDRLRLLKDQALQSMR